MGRQIWRRISRDESGLRLCLSILWRLVILVIIPLSVYVGVFYAHLAMLPKAGPHDSVMTSAFQASLKGGLASITKGQPLHVAHGSQITLRYLLFLLAILCHQRILCSLATGLAEVMRVWRKYLIVVGNKERIRLLSRARNRWAEQIKDSSFSIFYAVVRNALDRNRWRQIVCFRSNQEADYNPQIRGSDYRESLWLLKIHNTFRKSC